MANTSSHENGFRPSVFVTLTLRQYGSLVKLKKTAGKICKLQVYSDLCRQINWTDFTCVTLSAGLGAKNVNCLVTNES